VLGAVDQVCHEAWQSPIEELGERISLVVMKAIGKGQEFLAEVIQPRRVGRHADQAIIDLGGLGDEADHFRLMRSIPRNLVPQVFRRIPYESGADTDILDDDRIRPPSTLLHGGSLSKVPVFHPGPQDIEDQPAPVMPAAGDAGLSVPLPARLG
jgi:hypothetical protein